MNEVEVRILARLRRRLAVVERDDDARSRKRREAALHALVIVARPFRRCVLRILQFFLQTVALLLRLQKTRGKLLHALLRYGLTHVLRRTELHGEHEAQHHADKGDGPPPLLEIDHKMPPELLLK